MGVFTTAALTAAVGNKISAATFWNGQVRDLILGFGAHTAYTPTITGFTQGNGTVAGRYTQIGKWVWFEATFTFGTTSAAATAAPTCSLPVTASATATSTSLTHGLFVDTGVNTYRAIGSLVSTTTCGAYINGTSGLYTNCTTTTPFTWGSTDVVCWTGIYAAA
jgi:hypothetical protein